MKEQLTFTGFQPTDLADVDALHDTQEQVLGEKVDRPNLLGDQILAAIGVRKDGELIGGFYIEAVGELCFIGVAPEATAMAVGIAPEVFEYLKKRGVRWLRCIVPKQPADLVESIGPKLEAVGLRRITDEFEVYAADLR